MYVARGGPGKLSLALRTDEREPASSLLLHVASIVAVWAETPSIASVAEASEWPLPLAMSITSRLLVEVRTVGGVDRHVLSQSQDGTEAFVSKSTRSRQSWQLQCGGQGQRQCSTIDVKGHREDHTRRAIFRCGCSRPAYLSAAPRLDGVWKWVQEQCQPHAGQCLQDRLLAMPKTGGSTMSIANPSQGFGAPHLLQTPAPFTVSGILPPYKQQRSIGRQDGRRSERFLRSFDRACASLRISNHSKSLCLCIKNWSLRH